MDSQQDQEGLIDAESRELVPIEEASRPVAVQQVNKGMIEQIKQSIMREDPNIQPTDDQIKFFLETAFRAGLDPFPPRKQIYPVFRRNNKTNKHDMVIQTGVDGLLAAAEKTGEYRGSTPVEWCGEDGEFRPVWLGKGYPRAARVGVMRAGFPEPLYRTAHWDEYVQKYGSDVARFWKQFPALMVGKCAFSLALRAAFPHVTEGIYSNEEMGQADNDRVIEGSARVVPDRRSSGSARPRPAEPQGSADATVVPQQSAAQKFAELAREYGMADRSRVNQLLGLDPKDDNAFRVWMKGGGSWEKALEKLYEAIAAQAPQDTGGTPDLTTGEIVSADPAVVLSRKSGRGSS